MNKNMDKKWFVVVLLGLILLSTIYLISLNKNDVQNNSFGSLNDNNAYTSSTTNSSYANTSIKFKGAIVAASSTPISGVLGSVIVTTTSATVVEIKDATSTTDLSSTTLATFGASPGTGTYTFDSAFNRGLMVNFLGSFVGNYTITWR